MWVRKIKVWQVPLAFVVWIGTMFLPATVNQAKLNTNFDYKKSRENFFYFLFHQVPFIVSFWDWCCLYHFFSFIGK